MDELAAFVSTCRPPILILCESWLQEDIRDVDILLPGYLTFRKDRNDGRRGGGVCVYIKHDIVVTQVDHLISVKLQCCEYLWLYIVPSNILLLTIYIPPDLLSHDHSSINDYIVESVDQLQGLYPYTNIIVAGDLNNFNTTELESLLGMKQMVTSPTRGSATLDKILLDMDLAEMYQSPVIAPKIGSSDHLTVILKSKAEVSPTATYFSKVYDYRHHNMTTFYKFLKDIPWHIMYHSKTDINEKCRFFYDKIAQAKECLLVHYVPMTESEKPWMTPSLKLLIHQRFVAYRSRNYGLYNYLKVKVKTEIDKAKRRWVDELKKIKTGLWNVVKQMNNPRAKTNNTIENLIAHYATVNEAANEINKEFATYFTPSTLRNAPAAESIGENWNISINTETIRKMLIQLNTRKASGSDDLSPLLLKLSGDFLAEPITHLLSLSIESGQVPEVWKEANIVPIPKGGPVCIKNLRPISLLPIIAKILERVVLTSVRDSLLSMYGSNQHGFRPNHSTLTSHLRMQEQITSLYDNKSTRGVIVLSFDLSRAFDRIPHANLIKRLFDSNLPLKFINWCTSYLLNRTQRVVLKGTYSSLKQAVSSGVPQGSILGPYLFCSYIGSLCKALPNSIMYKYADDVVIISPFTTSNEVLYIVDEEIRNISSWCETNGLVINTSKTKLMIVDKCQSDFVQPSSLPAPISESLTVLGVVFHQSLKWNAHTHKIAKTASQRIWLLKNLKRLRTIGKDELLTVYFALIRSILEYNSPLFVGLSKREENIIDKLQRRCHRIICSDSCTKNCLPSLSERRKQKAMQLFKRAIEEKNHPLNDIMPHTLPRSHKLSIPYCRTKCRQTSFVPYCTLVSNSFL